MKLNLLFKRCIDIAYFVMLPIVFFFPGTIMYMLFFPQQTIIKPNVPFEYDSMNIYVTLFLFFVFIEFVIFFIGFYHLRSLSKSFLKKKFFTSSVVLKLKRVGQFFSICGLSSILILVATELFTSETTRITIGLSTNSLLFFLMLIGMFFLLLSNAFEKAIAYKSENDLTI